jgi:hypothetical protein
MQTWLPIISGGLVVLLSIDSCDLSRKVNGDKFCGWLYNPGMKSKRKPRSNPKKLGRPATGQTPKRYFRIKDESWDQIIKAAHASGGTISDYLRRVLTKDAARVLKRGK